MAEAMSNDYLFPIIWQDKKRLALRHHVALYSRYPISVINRLIGEGKIATTLIGFNIYIDVDEALTVLSESRFNHRYSASAASKILTDKQKQNLFV